MDGFVWAHSDSADRVSLLSWILWLARVAFGLSWNDSANVSKICECPSIDDRYIQSHSNFVDIAASIDVIQGENQKVKLMEERDRQFFDVQMVGMDVQIRI